MVYPLHVWLAYKQTFGEIKVLTTSSVNSPTVLVFHITRGLINPLFLCKWDSSVNIIVHQNSIC